MTRQEKLKQTPRLTFSTIALLAVSAGFSVGSNYYSQSLLGLMRGDLHLNDGVVGFVVTLSQLGFATGVIFLLPLGDLLERRRLVVAMMLALGVAHAAMACAGSALSLFVATAAIGIFSVVGQVIVSFAANLATPEVRGKVVGTVMSGLFLGILLARTMAGYLAEFGGWHTVYWTASGLALILAIALGYQLPTAKENSGLSYPRLLQSVVSLFRSERVLRLRGLYGALSFGAFSIFWTSNALLLAGPGYGYSPGTIGLFGLVGVAGIIAASAAGRFADRGGAHRTTGGAAVLLVVCWLPLGLGTDSLAALVIGVIILDFAAQGLHITNQSEIYRLDAAARSRITAGYMIVYFAGGATGSTLSSLAFAGTGWLGVCVVGAVFGLVALSLWSRDHFHKTRTKEKS